VFTSFALSHVSRLSDLLGAGDEERTQPISQRRIVAGNSSMMIIRLRIRMSLCVIESCPLVFLLNLLIVFFNMSIRHRLRGSMKIPCFNPDDDQGIMAYHACSLLASDVFPFKGARTTR
jgi:hypothetical protein